MNLIQKIKYYSNWNIGFCEQTAEELISTQKLRSIHWMKHPFKDRWFADPFIYKVTDEDIVVFVEECMIDTPKGIISELVIDRKNYKLKDRYILLELTTHLSYPAIVRENGIVYVHPENGASGKLNIYQYDEHQHRLVNPRCILDEAVADATMYQIGGQYYISATKFPDTQEKAFIYCSDSILGPFVQMSDKPYQNDKCCSRCGGNLFRNKDRFYRPAQNCELRYGGSLNIMSMKTVGNSVEECLEFELKPQGNRYNLGLHTLNFDKGICVVDGYGYLYPFISLFIKRIRKIIINK